MITFVRQGSLAQAVVLALTLIWSCVAVAAGPVAAGGLPGGAGVADSDTGNGQGWGRANGRTITYTITDPSQFASVAWGVVNGTSPSVAFDGAVTPATPEVLTYSPGDSTPGGGVARWTGQALLTLVGGSYSGIHAVPTRFTLTVTAGGNPLGLAFVSGGVSPGADVLAAGVFTANLLFEMQYIGAIGGDSSWRPVLDLYDALPTPTGPLPATNTGPVMTGVSTGFYYTGQGLSLEQHDSHIAGLLSPIANDVAFLKIDVPGRLQGLSSDTSQIRGDTSQIRGDTSQIRGDTSQIRGDTSQLISMINQILSQGSGGAATADDVENAKNDLQQMLLILFGLLPCPDPQLCSQARFINQLATQANLDGVRSQSDAILARANQLATQASVDAVKAQTDAIAPGFEDLGSRIDDLQVSLDLAAASKLEVTPVKVFARANGLRWLVKITRDGALVDADFTQLLAIQTGNAPVTAPNVRSVAAVARVAQGLYDVSLTAAKGVTDGTAYLFQAQLMDGPVAVMGSALIGN